MWNQIKTDEYEGMLAETMSITGYTPIPGPQSPIPFFTSTPYSVIKYMV